MIRWFLHLLRHEWEKGGGVMLEDLGAPPSEPFNLVGEWWRCRYPGCGAFEETYYP